MNDTKRLIYIVIILLIINLSVTSFLLIDKFVNKPRTTTTTYKGSIEKRPVTNSAEFKQGYFLSLQPPPSYAIGGPSVLNDTYEIPPLNTSNVYVIAYYNAGQEINLTKASRLQGLSIDKWGFSYFDGTYTFHDPINVPSSNSEAYANSTIAIRVRVRSDGWVLAWIEQNQSLSDVILSGLKYDEVGTDDPYISLNITTLSYTIYKVLEQADIASNDDNDGDGVPDDLVSISQSTGYYDYKYCGAAGKIGYLSIFGVRDSVNKATAYKIFDFIIGNAYDVKDIVLIVDTYISVKRWVQYVYAEADIYLSTNTSFNNPIYHFRVEAYNPSGWSEKTDYHIRRLIPISFQIKSGTLYYSKMYLEGFNFYGSSNEYAKARMEFFIAVLTVLK